MAAQNAADDTVNASFEPEVVDEETFVAVLTDAREALERRGVDALVIGGIASAAQGRERWTHDIDLLVRPEDADQALQALAEAGFDTQETYPDWLYKAYKHKTLVDLIFCASDEVFLDEDMLARARECTYGDLTLRVMGPEDLLVVKALGFKEHTPRHWFDALGLLAECEFDWTYLLRRAIGRDHRVLSLLVFAQGEGLPVPDAVVRRLIDRVYAPHEPDEYVVGRLQEILAHDPRTHELGIDATVSDDTVVLSGTVISDERRESVLEVAREALHGLPVRDQLTVTGLGPPEDMEEVS